MKISQSSVWSGPRRRFASASACCALLAAGLLFAPSAHALSNLPYHDDFSYADGTGLDGTNGWRIFTTGPGYGLSDPKYHGWQGVPGGTATATNGDGRVAGVSLLKTFGDYTGEPGTGWPSTSGEFDKAPLVTVRYEYEPDVGYVHASDATIWSKFGNMFWTTRWHYESRGGYYKMMTVVRYFVKSNGLISAYNGHRIKHLSHAPITNRTTLSVVADYENHVWSLWVGEQQVVNNFALYKTDDGTDMEHDGWYKDYDGLKEIGFTDASTNAATRLDTVRVFEGLPSGRTIPLIETFETRTIGGETVTMSPGDLNGQNDWFASGASVSAAAQSSQPYSVGSQGAAISAGGECFQLYLDQQTNVWTELWLKPAASGSGETTVDAGGEDGVFRVDASGDVYAYDGVSASVVTSVVPTAWSRFTVHTDYGSSTWSLYLNGAPLATGLSFLRVDVDDSYEELRISAAGTAVAHVDDLSVGLDSPFILPTVSFQTDTANVGEGVMNVTVNVMLSHAYGQSVAVDYVLGPGGTASQVADFSASDGTLIFAAGETNKSFSFTIVNDVDNEEHETLGFYLTNIVNAAAGSHLAITYTITSDPADWDHIPFYEPFEARAMGDLNGQHGWTSTHMVVQTNDTFAGTNAARGLRIGSRHSHAFDEGLTRVLAEWRAKPVFSRHPVTPPAGSTYAFYVSTNGHVVAYDGTTATDMGIYTTLVEGEWAQFKVFVDHVSETWDLHVNGTLLGPGLGFYSSGSGTFSEMGVVGPVVIDNVDLRYASPVAPTGLVAQAGDGTVDLSWGSAIGADEYRIKRATSSGGPYAALATLSATNYQDVSALNDVTYYYVVSALNDAGEGPNSAEASAIPRANILGFNAVGGFNVVDLSWEAYAGATNYVLQRAYFSGGPYATIATTNATSFTDLVVVNETTYFYTLTALTPGYASPVSPEVAATPDLRTIFFDSFEAPDVGGRAEGHIPGWERTLVTGNADSRAGLWDESTTSMITPFGEQAAWVWNNRMISTTNITETLNSNATYRLTFNAASEYGLGGIEYYVELLAGTHLLGTATSGWALDTYDFASRSDRIDFTVPTNHPGIGQPLGIRLKFLTGDWHYVLGYDNVRLATDDATATEVAGADTNAPTPNPMTFAVAPAALDASRVRMTATTAADESAPISYLFENLTNGNIRTWSTSPTWTETGLSVGQTYGYRVKARDVELNETDWSVVAHATPVNESVPPTPNPMTFAVAPTVLDQTRVVVTASIASDPSVPVQYTFENTTNGNVRTWSTSTVWTNTGLVEGLAYGYRVKARDAWSNETAWSAVATATPTHENDPPLPNPMQFSAPPAAIDQFSITMAAAAAVDVSGPVAYHFTNTVNGDVSGWQTDQVWTNVGLALGATYGYRVKARDAWSNETAWSAVNTRRTKLEIDPPIPDPMTFVGVPTALDETRIVMTATTAVDAHGPVLYRFENMTNGNVRHWSTNPVWTNSSLFPGQTHGYRVKALDDELNETEWSTVLSATTVADATAPTPDPMQFFRPPAAIDRNTIVMTAEIATDPFYAVSYYFENVTNGANSGWVTNPVWTNAGLTYARAYGYRVKARDAVLNETAWSAVTIALAEDVLLYGSFETPVVTGQAALAAPGWSAPNGRGYQRSENGGSITTPYGEQVATVFLGSPSSYRLETTDMTNQLEAGTTYTLSLNVGNVNVSTGSPRTDNQYTAQLLAGGNVVATASGTTTSDAMTQTDAVTFKPAASDPNLGGALRVRLMMTGGDWHAHSLFDNVRIGAAQIPLVTLAAPSVSSVTTNAARYDSTLETHFTHADVEVHWGTANAGTNAAAWQHSMPLGSWTNVWTTNLSFAATGLASGTQYFYTFQASNDAVDVWSSPVGSFWTGGKPGVDTAGGATNIGIGSASLQGRLVSTGGVSLAEVRIYFGDEDGGMSPGSWDASYVFDLGSISAGVPFTTNVTGLSYGLAYRYRVFASNVYGGAWSELATFTTLPPSSVPELTADGQTFPAYFENYGGQSWLLIGRGRDGWDFDANGQGTPAEVSESVDTSGAFAPKAFSDAIVNDLFAQAGMSLSSVTLRVARASSIDGTGEDQELRYHTLTGFPNGNADFTFDFDTSSRRATIDRINAPAGLAGATTGSLNDDIRDHNAGNDARRVFTFAWGNHNNRKGFSYGSSVSGAPNNDPATFLWEYNNENYAIPYTEVYVPYDRPATASIAITNAAATNITAETADLVGALDASDAVFAVNVYWSTNDNADAAAWVADGDAAGMALGTYTNVLAQSLTAAATSLTRGQTYYYTMVATNAATEIWAAPNASFTTDGTPPTPDPMTFAVPPDARDASSVAMVASTASDALNDPVQYYFENTTNSDSSGWTAATVWTNNGLTTGEPYGYRVKARDAVSNETGYSAVETAVPAVDGTPPSPSPMSFAVAPAMLDASSIAMSATPATDPNLPIEYLFENTNTAQQSAWITSTVWTNTGLTPGVDYGFRIRARDAVSNNTAWSSVSRARITTPVFISAVPTAWHTIELAWQDHATNETGYLLQRSTNGTDFTALAALAADTTFYSDSGWHAARTYSYRLAVTNAGEGSATAFTDCETNAISAGPPAGTIFYESFESPIVSGHPGLAAPGWVSPRGRVYQYNEGEGLITTPYGHQAAGVFLGGPTSYRIETTGITNVLVPGTTYTLTFNAGNVSASSGNPRSDNRYTVALMAGAAVVDSASAVTSTDDLSEGGTISFTPAPGHSNAGQALGIRLTMTGGDWHAHALFDNLHLTAVTVVDNDPPSPDPMGWYVGPWAGVNTSAVMIASNATDTAGVQYCFTNTVNGDSSGWINSRVWTNAGLSDGVSYNYRVKARDLSLNLNETGWSPAQGTTADGTIILYDSFELPVISGRTPENGTMALGWSRSNGRAGLWNEDSGTMSTPFGYQSAWLWHDRYMTTTASLLSETLTAGTTYTLTFNAAAENGGGGIHYEAQLLAGGGVVAGVNGGAMTSSDMLATSDSLVFTPSLGHLRLGQELAVRLRYLSGDYHWVMGFDNVTLKAVPGVVIDPGWKGTLYMTR